MLKPFDPADHIDGLDDIHAYLEAALEDTTIAHLSSAVRDVLRAIERIKSDADQSA
jgi:DNA-binding phage protein